MKYAIWETHLIETLFILPFFCLQYILCWCDDCIVAPLCFVSSTMYSFMQRSNDGQHTTLHPLHANAHAFLLDLSQPQFLCIFIVMIVYKIFTVLFSMITICVWCNSNTSNFRGSFWSLANELLYFISPKLLNNPNDIILYNTIYTKSEMMQYHHTQAVDINWYFQFSWWSCLTYVMTVRWS